MTSFYCSMLDQNLYCVGHLVADKEGAIQSTPEICPCCLPIMCGPGCLTSKSFQMLQTVAGVSLGVGRWWPRCRVGSLLYCLLAAVIQLGSCDK